MVVVITKAFLISQPIVNKLRRQTELTEELPPYVLVAQPLMRMADDFFALEPVSCKQARTWSSCAELGYCMELLRP